MSPSTFKELRKLMSQFLDDIEAAIKNIHVAHGITSDDITKQVADAVTTGITPLQSQITDLQGQVAELQKAAQDTVAAINSGDTAGAQAIATAALAVLAPELRHRPAPAVNKAKEKPRRALPCGVSSAG